MTQDILTMAKSLLPENFSEDKLNFWAAEVEAYICSFCNTDHIPAGCESLAARMIAAAADGSWNAFALKSVTRGDFSASYDAAEHPGIDDFDRRLTKFRRLSWKRK